LKKLTLIPIYNEERHIKGVLESVWNCYDGDILIVNDGSTDRSAEILAGLSGVKVITHPHNIGYGRSLADGFRYAVENGYDFLVTIDCDEQHEPHHIPEIFRAVADTDVYSASRYLREAEENDEPPADRYRINMAITGMINSVTGYRLTDGFCGLKGYRVKPLAKMDLRQNGYAFPIEFWIQAWRLGLKITEFPIERIYRNLNRTFGANLDDPDKRLRYYREVLRSEVQRWRISSPLELTRTI